MLESFLTIVTTTNLIKKVTYIKCKKCGTEIFQNAHKKMTPCQCGVVEVDGCDEYTKVIGNDKDCKFIQI